MRAGKLYPPAGARRGALQEPENSTLPRGHAGEHSTHYEETMPGGKEEWEQGWRKFERTIRQESRFFSRSAAAQLSTLFDTIDKMRTAKGAPLVVDAGPGTGYAHLFRARVFHSDESLERALERPDRELASPPSHLTNAGRMNAKGISVFYGASTPATALAEVRPPVGSKVAIAQFDITRSLRLLDLTVLNDVHESGSIFDPGYADRLGRMMFLRGLTKRIARPVMPNDQDAEYLTTQAIADFLATESKVPLDGILYPSVQVDGRGLNVVLFHKASKCAELDIPKETEISATAYPGSEEDPDYHYWVLETVLSEPKAKNERKRRTIAVHPLDEPADCDARGNTLSVDAGSLIILHVKAVAFDTVNFKVYRRRRFN